MIDITIRKNTERKSFKIEYGPEPYTFIPPYIGIAHTKRGVWYEKNNGSPDVELGVEYPRSVKGFHSYEYINEADYMFMDVEKGLTIDLCGRILVAEKDSKIHIENVADPLFEI